MKMICKRVNSKVHSKYTEYLTDDYNCTRRACVMNKHVNHWKSNMAYLARSMTNKYPPDFAAKFCHSIKTSSLAWYLHFLHVPGSTIRGSEVPQGRQRSKFEARLIVRANTGKGGLFRKVSRSSLRLTFNGRLGLPGGIFTKGTTETSKHLWVTGRWTPRLGTGVIRCR